MVNLTNEQIEQIDAQQEENRYGTSIAKLSLKGDGAQANVMFFTLHSVNDIKTCPTHTIGMVSKKGQPYTRTVACLRNYGDDISKCPICAYGNKAKTTISYNKSTVIDETKVTYLSPIFLVDMNLFFDGVTGQFKPIMQQVQTKDANGLDIMVNEPKQPELKLQLARSTFRNALKKFIETNGDISNKVVTIIKHVPLNDKGQPDNFNTSYTFAVNPAIQPIDCSQFQIPDNIDNDIVDITYEQADNFIQTGTIFVGNGNQQNDSVPFSNDQITRRTPQQDVANTQQPIQQSQPVNSVPPTNANPYGGNTANVTYQRGQY